MARVNNLRNQKKFAAGVSGNPKGRPPKTVTEYLREYGGASSIDGKITITTTAGKVIEKMTKAGYSVQVFLLNAASMGVPQKRERVFFIGSKKELNFPKLKLEFNERAVVFGEIKETGLKGGINGQRSDMWDKCKQGKSFATVSDGSNFSSMKLSDTEVCSTIIANQCEGLFHSTEKRKISENECKLIGTYPMDYNFKELRPKYLIGMSVPPVMTAQIANQMFLQWFDKQS